MKLLNDKMEVSELIHFYLFYNYNYCYFFLLYMATFFAAAYSTTNIKNFKHHFATRTVLTQCSRRDDIPFYSDHH